MTKNYDSSNFMPKGPLAKFEQNITANGKSKAHTGYNQKRAISEKEFNSTQQGSA